MKIDFEKIKLLFRFVKYINLTFSQEGEDVLISKFIDFRKKGFYVDIGAHHPMRFSNTCRLYLNGWNGINIDAAPDAMKMFEAYRKRDINISCGIAEHEGNMSFYIFKEPAFNTFDKKLAEERINKGNMFVNEVKVPVKRLEQIFDQYLNEKQVIDIMSLDIEGYELEALRSNDWKKWRPRYILCESLFRGDLEDFFEGECVRYLRNNGYEVKSILDNTILFIDSQIDKDI